MAENQIRLLSLNCWGLKYVAKNRNERIEAIARELGASNYDIIGLQEIWVYSDYQRVQRSVAAKLPYSKFFYSGALGAGLAIFSRFPIISTSVHPYSLNGAPIDVSAGDWFVGKAAGSITVQHPVIGQIQVFTTHLFAKGGEDGPEYNRAHRLVNAWEFAKLARQAAELGRYVIALGDFNSIPTTLPMAVIREHAALSDSWAVTHPGEGSLPAATNPQEAIIQFGVTADSPTNSYSAGKPLDPTARKYLGKRLDYVFYRQPHHYEGSPKVPHSLRAADCRVVLTDIVPNYDFSYSDHFGLEATLVIEENREQLNTTATPSDSSRALSHPQSSSELSGISMEAFISALSACYQFSRQRARKELQIFGLCLVLLVGVIVGTPWLPYGWINPIFFIFTIFITWLGTTMLYEGFLYGYWEQNALMNVIEELEIHQKHLGINASPSLPHRQLS